MDATPYEELLSSLPPLAAARLLAFVGHRLTIAAREGYEMQGPGVADPEMLRGINEIQHRLFAQIHSLLAGVPPADIAARIAPWLAGEGQTPRLRAQLAWALEGALRLVQAQEEPTSKHTT